jgi:hypothetical protein
MRPLSLLALLLLGPALSGCILECRLRADGSGKLMLQYHVDEKATVASVAQRLDSPSVVVRSGRIDRQGIGTFKLEFEDASKLSTTQMLKNVSVSHAPGAQSGTTGWTAKLVQPKPFPLPEKAQEHFGKDMTVTITFPGAVVATNATSHDGATAKWVIPLNTLTSSPETVFTVTYTNADSPAAGS